MSVDYPPQFFGRSRQDQTAFGTCLPKVFEARGGGQGLTGSGTVPNPTRPFTLNASFPGGASVHSLTPSGPGCDASSHTLCWSGVTGKGQGHCTLISEGANWPPRDQTHGCVSGVPQAAGTAPLL